MPRRLLAALVLAGALAPVGVAAAAEPALRAGAGRADITPPTGYPLLGWARGDARALGQHTRLFARAIVLERGGRRLALVAADLNMVPGGLVQQAAGRAGLTPREVVVSASHTHAGPTGFSNFRFKDSAVPTPRAPASGVSELDPLLYAFLVDRLATALRRARADLGPAAAGWGADRLTTLTRNRSLEAHLADHGLRLPRGAGRVEQDPEGAAHTIDPAVDVLRVDRLVRGRRVPLGAWGLFANHGTTNRASFTYYGADHHASAARTLEAGLRRAGRVPRGREVVGVYGNGDAGDVSSGLDRTGPAHADAVGRREAHAMLRAWRAAGTRMTRTPALAVRWTRVCFCGQDTPAGPLADRAVFGSPWLTGSEEGRGPLFEATGEVYEGRRLDAPAGPQGVKVVARGDDDGSLVPTAVPLTAARVADRLLVTAPGELTTEMGRRVKAAALAAVAGRGMRRAVLAGYANEYASYFTTPEEYDAQHYEGGTTLFGPASGPFLAAALADLARRLATGRPAPAPVAFDPTRGVRPTARRYPPGSARGRVLSQPRDTARLARPSFRWRGAAAGLDRPLDRAFVRVERRTRAGWRTVDSDLGVRLLWRVDDARPKVRGVPRFRAGEPGVARAWWEPPAGAALGRHRFVVDARRFTLVSRPFLVRPTRRLRALVRRQGRRVVVRLAYPAPVPERDLAARPAVARRGTVRVRVGRATRILPVRDGRATLAVSAGVGVAVPPGGGRDEHGNRTGAVPAYLRARR